MTGPLLCFYCLCVSVCQQHVVMRLNNLKSVFIQCEEAVHSHSEVVVPTRVGQVYVYDTVKPDQDEYDVPPRHQPPTQQDIYDVPPTRQQYNTQ
ncbi:breast cancer anti-estrogen resistance protein 1-like, partial [Micropterus dolomieu]|uniref:breast cancer anti-estrogen resistance protein 1-like n=1 Tax=Micropterus dolomieu TaxID=147949 RepID=UPI001E8EA757